MNSTQAVSPDARGEMSLARLSAGNMLFVYAPFEASEFYYSVYSSGHWGQMNVTAGSGLQSGMVKQVSAVSDDNQQQQQQDHNNNVYLFYVKNGNSGDLMVARWNSIGTFLGFETVDSSLSHSLPSASIGINGKVHVFTLANNQIYDPRI
jgi:hypothetical protein